MKNVIFDFRIIIVLGFKLQVGTIITVRKVSYYMVSCRYLFYEVIIGCRFHWLFMYKYVFTSLQILKTLVFKQNVLNV